MRLQSHKMCRVREGSQRGIGHIQGKRSGMKEENRAGHVFYISSLPFAMNRDA